MITSDKETLQTMHQNLCVQMVKLMVLQLAIIVLGIYIEKGATAKMAYSLGKPFIFANLFVECIALYTWARSLLACIKDITLWDRVLKHDIYYVAFYVINVTYCFRVCSAASQIIRGL